MKYRKGHHSATLGMKNNTIEHLVVSDVTAERARRVRLRKLWRLACRAFGERRFLGRVLETEEIAFLHNRRLSTHVIYFLREVGVDCGGIAWALQDAALVTKCSKHYVSVAAHALKLPAKPRAFNPLTDDPPSLARALYAEGARISDIANYLGVKDAKAAAYIRNA